MKQSNAYLAVLIVCCMVLLVSSGNAAGAAAPDADNHLTLQVLGAWIPARVSLNDGSGSAAAEADHSFIAVEMSAVGLKSLAGLQTAIKGDKGIVGLSTYPSEGTAHVHSTDVVLHDSKGDAYVPIGAVSGGMAFFRGRTMLAGDMTIVSGDRPPAGSGSLVYVYEVPVGREGFTISVDHGKPMPVTVSPR